MHDPLSNVTQEGSLSIGGFLGGKDHGERSKSGNGALPVGRQQDPVWRSSWRPHLRGGGADVEAG